MNTYDPMRINVAFNDVPMLGMHDGTFVKALRNKDSFEVKIGSKGEGARVASADKSGIVEVTLLSTSVSNDYLSSQLAIDELTKEGGGALILKDAAGTTLVSAKRAWVKKYAEIEFSNEVTGRTWTFETDELLIVVGGSAL